MPVVDPRAGLGHYRRMDLLERDQFLAVLEEYGVEAADGQGRLVLVSGEAGVGKTTLLESFADRFPRARWWWGTCDGSFTPRALGPLIDIAEQAGGRLAQVMREAPTRDAVLRVLLDEMSAGPGPTVLVLEDLHWADEATLDILRFLGKRLRGRPVVVLVSYRDDALAPDHPLRVVLGELVSQRSTRRLAVPPLSPEAVAVLAQGSGREGEELYRLTGGDAFFLVQVLESDAATLPPSAQDAVRSRLAGLPTPTREVLEAAAVVGRRVDLRLLSSVLDRDIRDVSEAVEAGCASGVLISEPDATLFRHEIARLAVESAIAQPRRVHLHERVLLALSATGADPARLAHHAEAAGDAAAVLRYAPTAAEQAARLAAHREAAMQYERSLRFAAGLPADQLARLYDGLAAQCALIDRWERGAQAREESLALWREAGDARRVGDCLRLLSRALWRLCRGEEANLAAQQAVDVLESLPPSRELAWAYANLASNLMGGDDTTALAMIAKARSIADADDFALHSDLANTEGCALANLGGDGVPELRSALAIALGAGAEEQAGRAYANLHAVLHHSFRFSEVQAVYLEGATYCDDHDIATFLTCLRGGQSQTAERRGQWGEAQQLSLGILDREELSPVNRLTPLLTLGRIRARQGAADEATLASEVMCLTAANGERGSSAPLTCCRSSVLGYRPTTTPPRPQWSRPWRPMGSGDTWGRGELAVWAQRCGVTLADVGEVAGPWATQLKGDHEVAAQQWHDLGCPYLQALALFDAGYVDSLRESVRILDELGAAAAAARVRSQMRADDAPRSRVARGARLVTTRSV